MKTLQPQKMNHASNESGATLLDDCGGSISLDGASTLSNSDLNGSRNATPSLSSMASSTILGSATSGAGDATPLAHGMELHQIFNYVKGDFVAYSHLSAALAEDVCFDFCRELRILPTTRLLFGLRAYETASTDGGDWAVPGRPLSAGVRYVFRMRFKVPALDKQLYALDPNAYEYLYRQMRSDMVRECIPEVRYPAKKDNVMGLGVVNMYIDLQERIASVETIEANYKRYLPRQLVKAHKVFVKPKICESFRNFRSTNIELPRLKWNYVHEVHDVLAPQYLMETYKAKVDFIPGDEMHAVPSSSSSSSFSSSTSNGSLNSTAAVGPVGSEAHVYVKLDLYDTAEPGMKISRITAEDKLKWILVAKLENIYALYTEGREFVRLEITGFPNGYRMQFERKTELESFITYLAGYIRLTSKWMLDLCVQYVTPSLQELKELRCHGPIGGSFSFAKIREKRDQCGSYIIRQCEKEYDTYYIDINTKLSGLQPEKCKTETFKIKKDNSNLKWILHFNEGLLTFDKLTDLAQHIPTDTEQHFRIPPSEYDKPPLLLICLPKNLQSKKTETELSEAELQRKRVQVFDPKMDLQWYKNSARECDNGKMFKMRADWIQQGSFKDVCVTLKVLKSDADFQEFMKLANNWGQIYSPQFIKLYGLTLSTPYTMIMEHAKYGPLNEFLLHMKDKVTVRSLLDVVHGLVRGIVYLQEYDIVHGYIRCSNLYVTKFDPKSNLLEAKIADPGFPRPYRKDELPWIPFEYYKDINAAKEDPNAELWAFATTVWEIFARGKPITNLSAEVLIQTWNRYGGILPAPSDDCPDEMYNTMLDGWSKEPDKRFNHQEIFSRLIFIKETLATNYATVDGSASVAAECYSDTSSMHSEFSNITEETFHTLKNGHSISDIQSCTFSSNSTTCDRAPLIRSSHQQPSQHQSPVGNHNNKPSYRSYFDDTPSVLQLPNGKVIYKKKIGEGHYGTVYLGEIRYNTPNMEREQVAIKTLKSLRLKQLNQDFLREIKIMQTLDHPNIVKIKQWVEEPISIIMEYLECGSFIVYLSSRKPNLTNEKLLRFALDIAKGMDYLRNQKVIHRDLAARNILVDRDRVKISDFGLAQIANSDGYYFAQSEREIPIKWYSPESIKTAKFSFQSDVWSYGVTLFEMFSRGEIPNLDSDQELTQEGFLNRLESGDRLRKPMLCPDIVYEKLMMPCWHANPKLRPNFKNLIEEIQSIKNESGEGI